MDFRILGPLEVTDGERRLALGGTKQRALLGLLLLHPNEVVASDHLVERLWGDAGRGEGSKALQVAVSRLRRVIDPDRVGVLATSPPGYELRVESGQLDLERFEELVAEGRAAVAAGDPAAGSAALGEALAIWRGPPLSDLAYESFAQTEIARLEERRLVAVEDRIGADLALGGHQELVAELQTLVEEEPLRERPRAQLMLALYRSGRQAEALEVYRDARHVLVDELGIEPGRELQALEGAILSHDPELDLEAVVPEPGAESAGAIFVGRRRELGELLRGLEDADRGRGSLFLVAGEPGIGKSRLAEELVAHARARGARVLVGRCWEAGGAPAYWPWVQSLRGYIGERDPEALRQELGAGAAPLAQLLPELGDVLPGIPQQPPLEPEAARFRLFDAVASFLTRAAAGRPIVLVLDDLHAADEPSLLLLRFVARELGDSRLLVLGAYRDVDPTLSDPLAETLRELVGERTTRRLALDGLAETDVAEYIGLTADVTPDPETVAAVYAQTEGNALFVDEVTRMLIAEEALGHRADGVVDIPQGVRDVIDRRIGRLSEDCAQALTKAAVLGREFALDTFARMIDGEPRDALELLDEAVDARVVGEAPASPGRLRFSHALVRDTLYDELTPARRLRLHAEAGEAIEALHAGNEEPHLAELAYHFVQAAPAGDAERAVDYARRAGDRAAALLAYEEAARLYEMSIAALEFADRPEEAVRCDLLLALGDAEARGGSLGAAQDTFIRAAEVARELDAADRLARAALGYGGRYVWFRAGKDQQLITLLEDALDVQPGGSGLRAMLLSRLAGALRDRPVPERRAALTEEALEIARTLGDPATLAYALEGTYASISWPRDADRWLSMAKELCEIAERLGDPEKAFAGHLHAFGAFMVRGDLEAAELEFEALASVAHALRQPLQLWGLAMARFMRALQAGRLEEAEQLVERELALGGGGRREADDATFQYVSHFCGWALGRERGELAETRSSLERYVADYPDQFLFRCMLASTYTEIGEEDSARAELNRLAAKELQDLEVGTEWFFGASLLAEVCERLGEPGPAPRLYEALRPYGDYVVITHPEINLGSADRYLGLLASVMGRADDAVAHFERAVAANQRMGFHPWLARTQADLARTLLARGSTEDVERAGELSRAALETFGALDMRDPVEGLRQAAAQP